MSKKRSTCDHLAETRTAIKELTAVFKGKGLSDEEVDRAIAKTRIQCGCGAMVSTAIPMDREVEKALAKEAEKAIKHVFVVFEHNDACINGVYDTKEKAVARVNALCVAGDEEDFSIFKAAINADMSSDDNVACDLTIPSKE